MKSNYKRTDEEAEENLFQVSSTGRCRGLFEEEEEDEEEGQPISTTCSLIR